MASMENYQKLEKIGEGKHHAHGKPSFSLWLADELPSGYFQVPMVSSTKPVICRTAAASWR
jgi:hypothetical protein